MNRALVGAVSLLAFFGVLALARPIIDRYVTALDLALLFKDGRYLILLENNNELRPGGGFIGSFATVNVKNGRPSQVAIGTNIYKLDNPYTLAVSIPPPAPLSGVAHEKWAFRDSNWAADFPAAARQVLWFFEEEKAFAGQPVRMDGVIVLTTTVIEELLRLSGPIEMPAYATTLTADNFAEVVQFKVEKEYYENQDNWPADEPKTILKDLIPILEGKIGELDKRALLGLAFRLLNEKYILLFSRDSLAERIILAQNWGGAVNGTRGNYLYLVNANIEGGKSSRKIEERVIYSLDRRTRQVSLTIRRHHTGSGIWPDAVNKNWVRVLVPEGSRLISARFGPTEATKAVVTEAEAGKTVFAFWLTTKPQETQDATLVYKLPSNFSTSPLLIQRQPGANPDEVIVMVDGQQKYAGVIRSDTTITL